MSDPALLKAVCGEEKLRPGLPEIGRSRLQEAIVAPLVENLCDSVVISRVSLVGGRQAIFI